MSKLERDFQAKLIKELRLIFKGCIILKNDPNYIQGFPDLTILYGDRWAVLECKRDKGASRQANQEYYIGKLGGMGYSRFVYPENKEEVLTELDEWFGGGRS